MKYKGYKITAEKNGIIVDNVKNFDPVHTFECGQCFRWIRQEDGSYDGVVRKKAVNIKFEGNRLFISNSTYEDFQNLWYQYLDLGRDYDDIKARLMKDEIMERAIKFGHGIRLLKQDILETLISFILSANNMIPRIMKSVEIISCLYGEEIHAGGRTYYSFPGVDELAGTNLERLEVCRGGFRCKYILQAAESVKKGDVDLYGLKYMNTPEARKELMKLPGVGPKVADCVLLYSGTKYDVFPTDVWVKRVMEELYFKRETSFKEIQEFASDYFGELAGFAQQYLFYYARENRIGAR